jgi:glycosyltransferase involved in cell wall biosynthesis
LAKEILPELSKSFPEIKLTIAGATPHATVKALENNQVIITGWVPKIQPIYSSARVFVAPMEIGSGMQNKILEAMAMEIPVVTSRLAAEPIGAKHNNELLVADSNEEFIQCIHSLLTDQNLRDEITQNAKNFVKEKFSWKSNTAKLLELIQNN